MPRRTALMTVAAVALVAAGWGFAQQIQTDRNAPLSGSGPYTVTVSGDTVVLLDTKTGRTWLLEKSARGARVWVPADLFTTRQEFLNVERAHRDAEEREQRRRFTENADKKPE